MSETTSRDRLEEAVRNNKDTVQDYIMSSPVRYNITTIS